MDFTSAVEQAGRIVDAAVVIVVIRTFLSWSLEVEISGRWPCQKDGVEEGAAADPP